jgi:hypothetical protein
VCSFTKGSRAVTVKVVGRRPGVLVRNQGPSRGGVLRFLIPEPRRPPAGRTGRTRGRRLRHLPQQRGQRRPRSGDQLAELSQGADGRRADAATTRRDGRGLGLTAAGCGPRCRCKVSRRRRRPATRSPRGRSGASPAPEGAGSLSSAGWRGSGGRLPSASCRRQAASGPTTRPPSPIAQLVDQVRVVLRPA